MWRATMIVGFFVLTCGFLFSGSVVLAETTSTPTCFDSDGGADFIVKGKTDGQMYDALDVFSDYNMTDHCNNAYLLVESICYQKGVTSDDVFAPLNISPYYTDTGHVYPPEGVNVFAWGFYDCKSEGKICYDGACVSTSTPATCYDTDGGDNSDVKGSVILSNNVVRDDGCHTQINSVWEGFCQEDGSFDFHYVSCSPDKLCQDDACVPIVEISTSTQFCYDSDSGFDYYNKGHLIGEMYQGAGNSTYHLDSYDACTDATRLSEYFCYKSGDEMPQYSAWDSNVPTGFEFGTWHTYNCADEGKLCNNGKCVVFGDPDMSGEEIVDQEEQDSAEDLAEEITYLIDGIEYYYGYGYYGAQNTEGKTMGYGYYPIYPQGYGYGYYGAGNYNYPSSSYGYGYYVPDYTYGYGYTSAGGKQSMSKQAEIEKILNPKILPGNPLYWFKLAGKNVRSWFTFDNEEKARLRMRYATEKLLEANKLINEDKDETAAKNMRRYMREVERVQKIIGKIEEKDSVGAARLANTAMRLRLKEQILLGKVERESPIDELNRVKEARRQALFDVKVNAERIRDPRQVRETLELALNVNTRPMGTVRGLEVLEAVGQIGLSEDVSQGVEEVKEQYRRRLKGEASDLSEIKSNLLSNYIERAGGDEVNYLRILDNLEESSVVEAVKEDVRTSRERIINRIETRTDNVKDNKKTDAVREILSNLSESRESDARIIKEVESRIKPELSTAVTQVRREIEQKVEDRRVENQLPSAKTSTGLTKENTLCPSGFDKQDSYLRDCATRPENTACVRYDDGFVWLVEDVVAGWGTEGDRIQITKGNNGEYYHILETNCVKTIRKNVEPGNVSEVEELEIERRDDVGNTQETIKEQTVEAERVRESIREVSEPARIIEEPTREIRRVEETRVVKPTPITPVVEERRCTEDTWDCGDWSACSTSGSQTRTCRMSYDCPDARTATPAQTQSCTPRCTEDTWDCGDWSACSTDGSQNRTCRMSYDCPDARTATPTQTQSCTPRCTADTWDCGNWSDCSEVGEQTRSCRLSNDCQYVDSTSPEQSQRCTPVVVTRYPDLTVSSVTYDPASITDGDSVTFYARINNQGEGGADASTAYLYIDGRVQGSLSVRTLVSGSTQSLTWSSIWPAIVGDHTYQVCVDAGGVLTETNENNNCTSGRLTVAEAVRGGRVGFGTRVWDKLASIFAPVTRAFKTGDEVLKSY